MLTESIIFAYVGPETVLPVTSALAAIGGMLLIAGRSVRVMIARCWQLVTRRED